MTKILSFDVGIKNLAFCFLDYNTIDQNESPQYKYHLCSSEISKNLLNFDVHINRG